MLDELAKLMNSEKWTMKKIHTSHILSPASPVNQIKYIMRNAYKI